MLDRLYATLGYAAAAAILAICLLIMAQVVLNIVARFGGSDWAWSIPAYAEIAGYLLAAGSFLALADALVHSVHIRVNLVTDRLGERARWIAELAALGIGALTAWLMVYAASHEWWQSVRFGDKSAGILAIPLAVPKFFMVIGLVVFAIAFVDLFLRSLRARRPILLGHGGE